MKKIVMVALIVLFFAMIIYIAARFLLFKEDTSKYRVIKTTVVKHTVKQIVRGSGIVVSHEQVDVTTKLPGEITGFDLKVGDQVKKDQVLFTIENNDIENEFNIASAEIEKAKKELEKLKASPDPALSLEAKNAFTKAEVAYEELQKTVNLKKKLYEEGFVSQKEYEDLLNKLEFSKNEYELAKKRYEEAISPPSEEELGLAEAKLNKLEIELNDLREKKEGREVIAKISGTVVDLKIDDNLLKRAEEIPAATPVLTLANLKENVFVEGEMYESDVNEVKVGQNVVIVFIQKDTKLKGVITEISLVAKSYGAVRKFPVEIQITEDMADFIRLGMRVDFQVVISERKDVLTVPLTYIHSSPGGKKVWIKRGEDFVFTPVKTGIYDDHFIEIVSGLHEGQEVYLGPPGSKIRAQKAEPQGRSSVHYSTRR